MKFIDKWESIKTEYITTRTSCAKLADKYGVSVSSISKKAASEHWKEKRKKYIENLNEKTVEKTVEKLSNENSEYLTKLITAADNAIETIDNIFSDPDQFNRWIVKQDYTAVEKTFHKCDTKSLKEAATTLRELIDIQRNLHGLLTKQEELKLEMENKKFNGGEDENESETGVVILPEINESVCEAEVEE